MFSIHSLVMRSYSHNQTMYNNNLQIQCKHLYLQNNVDTYVIPLNKYKISSSRKCYKFQIDCMTFSKRDDLIVYVCALPQMGEYVRKFNYKHLTFIEVDGGVAINIKLLCVLARASFMKIHRNNKIN